MARMTTYTKEMRENDRRKRMAADLAAADPATVAVALWGVIAARGTSPEAIALKEPLRVYIDSLRDEINASDEAREFHGAISG